MTAVLDGWCLGKDAPSGVPRAFSSPREGQRGKLAELSFLAPCSFSVGQPRAGQGPQQGMLPAPSLVPGAETHGPHLGRGHRVERR